MTGLRYHALALATCLVTLATGVVVGVGPLSEQRSREHRAETRSLRAEQAALRRERAVAVASARGDRALATSLAEPLTAGALRDRTVAVIGAPHADRALVRRTSAVLTRAGATVTGTLSLTDVYVDPGKARSPLEDVALRLVPPGVTFPRGASPIQRVGTVLARATVTDAPTAAGVDQQAAAAIAGLSDLSAIRLAGEPGRLAELAVVVAGPPARGDAERARGAADAMLGLVAALDATATGVVVAGRPETAAPRRLVGQVRAAPETVGASTLDTAGSLSGDVALVLGLVEQGAQQAGDYGTGRGAEALVPRLGGTG